jgi:hypothetical protein
MTGMQEGVPTHGHKLLKCMQASFVRNGTGEDAGETAHPYHLGGLKQSLAIWSAQIQGTKLCTRSCLVIRSAACILQRVDESGERKVNS